LELRQLKYFVSIVENGSISKAAARAYIAQSALSHQLAQLESELGTLLLHRSSKGAILTDSGKVFYRHAQAILRQVNDIRSAVRKSPDDVVGSVLLGIPQSVSAALALPLLVAARKRLPGVSLQLNEELLGNLTGQLRNGLVNLAILFDSGQLGEFDHRQLVEEELCLVRVATKNKVSKPATVTLEKAVSQPLVLTGVEHGHGYGMRSVIEEAARQHDLLSVLLSNMVVEVNSLNILKSAVMAGFGATILPRAAVADEVRNQQLQVERIVSPRVTRIPALCAAPNVPMTNAMQAMSDLVVEVAGELCSSGAWDGTAPITCATASNGDSQPRNGSGRQARRSSRHAIEK